MYLHNSAWFSMEEGVVWEPTDKSPSLYTLLHCQTFYMGGNLLHSLHAGLYAYLVHCFTTACIYILQQSFFRGTEGVKLEDQVMDARSGHGCRKRSSPRLPPATPNKACKPPPRKEKKAQDIL